MARDYYDVLGVPKNASDEQKKEAYRKLVLKLHPDINKDHKSEEKMKEVNEAYAVLGDSGKRQQYDAYGPEQFSQHYTQEDIFRNFNIDEVFRSMGIRMDFGSEDILSGLFGFPGRGQRGDFGSDILARIDVSIRDAARGTDKEVGVRHVAKCENCNGTGADPSGRVVSCERCGGSGQLRTTRRSPFGVMQTIATCSRCNGTGKVPSKPCRQCNGTGKKHLENRIKVTIPKGVATGIRLRVRGMGDFGKDRPGDLYIDVNVLPDKVFKRSGDDIRVDAKVPFHVAALGGEIAVPTLEGEKSIRISEGTQSDSEVKLKGMGMPRFGGSGSGDEIVRIVVDVPKHLTKEQKEYLEKLADLDGSKKRKFGIF